MTRHFFKKRKVGFVNTQILYIYTEILYKIDIIWYIYTFRRR